MPNSYSFKALEDGLASMYLGSRGRTSLPSDLFSDIQKGIAAAAWEN